MSASLNNKLRNARSLLQNGDVAGARDLCTQILAGAPRNPEALTLRGIAALMAGAPADAVPDLRLALAAAPADGAMLEYLALAQLHLGAYAEAEQHLRRASAIPGAPASVWMRLGLALLHQQRPGEALQPLLHALALSPRDPDILLALGRTLAASGDHAGAEQRFEDVLRLTPGHPDALFNLGALQLAAGNLAQARALFEQTLKQAPDSTDAMVNLAIVRERDGAGIDAAALLGRALSLAPHHPHAHANLGRLLAAERRFAEARTHYEAALAAEPGLVAALEGLGAVSNAQGRYGEAVRHWHAATAREPSNAAAWAALAENLLQIGNTADADAAAKQASAADPSLPAPWGLRAQLQMLGGELEAAVDLLEEGYTKTAATPLLGMMTHQLRQMCDWPRWQKAWQRLRPLVSAGEDAGTPFALLSEDLDAAEILEYTRRWARRRFGASPAAPARHEHDAGSRLRIGYLSSDFQDHPAAYLVAELLELHDRERFEIHAYSHGPRDEGAMRRRIIDAVEHFTDIAWEPDDLAIERIRKDRIDILVDLKGYTVGDRLGILAQRPAPVQVTWLGYPGTTGTDFVDYLIADPLIVPPGADTGCSERIMRMPHCYQPTDRKRIIGDPLPRAGYDLPESALVLCCFNQTFKITPDVFAVWLRVLHAVPDSVLWLVDANRWATANLRRTAIDAGIAAHRLIFAPRMPLADHLARYRVADLALDTFPYTSHTTASDALWCGCPLVALCGATFPARVSASILTACGLPDLVTGNLDDYAHKLLELAGDREALNRVSVRVAAARTQAPLFDTVAFTRDLETLYLAMHKGDGNARA